jgi:hypothetical protein
MGAIPRQTAHLIASGTRQAPSEMAPVPQSERLNWSHLPDRLHIEQIALGPGLAGCLFFARVSPDETQLAAWRNAAHAGVKRSKPDHRPKSESPARGLSHFPGPVLASQNSGYHLPDTQPRRCSHSIACPAPARCPGGRLIEQSGHSGNCQCRKQRVQER